jgi:hypothetical protein
MGFKIAARGSMSSPCIFENLPNGYKLIRYFDRSAAQVQLLLRLACQGLRFNRCFLFVHDWASSSRMSASNRFGTTGSGFPPFAPQLLFDDQAAAARAENFLQDWWRVLNEHADAPRGSRDQRRFNAFFTFLRLLPTFLTAFFTAPAERPAFFAV